MKTLPPLLPRGRSGYGAVVAVTLQGADQGDTTTLDETLWKAGMAVAEQIGREAELRPGKKKWGSGPRVEEQAGLQLSTRQFWSASNDS